MTALSKDPRSPGPSGLVRMPMEKYLEHPALSRSTLDKIIKTPRHLLHHVEFGGEETPALLQGRVLHSLLLEPKAFWANVVVWDGGSKTTGEGAKTRWKEFQEKHAGKDIITPEQKALFEQMSNVFNSHILTSRLLVGAKVERAAFWERDGIRCKARPDIITKAGAIYDLKTTGDASFESFEYDAKKYGYHRQAAWYLDGMTAATGQQHTEFFIIAMEKKPPFGLQVFHCDRESIEKGRAENDENFERFKTCLEANQWPGFPSVIQRLSLARRAP